MRKGQFHTILICLLFALAGCTKSGSGDGADNGGENADDGGDFTPDCGVVLNGELENSVSKSQGIATRITDVLSGSTVSLLLDGGPLLVKLHGIQGADDFLQGQAVDLLRSLAGGRAYFYQATETCSVSVSGGGRGTSGHVLIEDGRSLTEELIKAGLSGSIQRSGTCSEELIASCYSALREQAPEEPAGMVTDFIWKPESDGGYRPGDLVVLASPCNADILVNGNALDDFGSYQGYCTLARGTRPGCSYGANVKVEVRDRSTGRLYAFPDGKLYYTVANGCNRAEFQGQ